MAEDNVTNGPQLVVTADGSHTLYNAAMHEHYHSKYGALQESVYVFINKGLDMLAEQGLSHISILEMGLGTGMNCFLTCLEARRKGLTIDYTALETAPVMPEMAAHLNYAALLNEDTEAETFQKIHALEWGSFGQLSPDFRLRKLQLPMQDFQSEEKYDLVYYDAFGPRAQPELWTLDIFQKLYALMNTGGILVTYCAKGDVRRNMLQAGLQAERLPGPPGKREMLRARR